MSTTIEYEVTTETAATTATVTVVCDIGRLTANRGVAAIVGGRAVALFLLPDGTVSAIDNVDPCSGASVLSRGIVGEVDGAATVASPMYKQRFDLRTGRCLDAEGVAVAVHAARVIDGLVEVEVEVEVEIEAVPDASRSSG